MAIPSQDLIDCKGCGAKSVPHRTYTLWCAPCAKSKQVEYQRQYRNRQKSKPRLKICKGCGKEFDVSITGRTWRCQACTAKYLKEYSDARKERGAMHSRNYRARQGDSYRAKMRQRRADLLGGMTQEQAAQFRKAQAEKSVRVNASLRRDVFKAYGGFKCACCGEREPAFLSIDHVNNDGASMRKSGVHGRGGTQFYQWLRRQGFPAGFQVLCMNCNVGKHRNGGICPHQLSKA